MASSFIELTRAMRGAGIARKFFPTLQIVESMKEAHAMLAFLTLSGIAEERNVTAADVRKCFDHLRLGIGGDGIVRSF